MDKIFGKLKLKIEKSVVEVPECKICQEDSDYSFGSSKMGYRVCLCNNCVKQIADFINKKED